MSDVSVRPCTVSDLSAIAAFDNLVGSGSTRWKHLRDLVDDQDATVLVAVSRCTDEIAAYVVVEHAAFFGRDFVELLIVAERWRRQGIGARLLQMAFERCGTDDVFTSTNGSNAPMRALLDDNGWTVSGVLDGLDEGDPEWVYRRRRTTR